MASVGNKPNSQIPTPLIPLGPKDVLQMSWYQTLKDTLIFLFHVLTGQSCVGHNVVADRCMIIGIPQKHELMLFFDNLLHCLEFKMEKVFRQTTVFCATYPPPHHLLMVPFPAAGPYFNIF